MRLSEKDILNRLKKDKDQFAPLFIKSLESESSEVQDGRTVILTPDGMIFQALLELKALASPKAIQDVCIQLGSKSEKMMEQGTLPVVVAPYIGSRQAEMLARAGISWLDLCGNMVIRIPDRLYIERTGKPNRYPDSAPIKKIFQGKSSLVSRALLLQPQGFSCLDEVVAFVNTRNANITIATVSKVLKSLEEELLVTKRNGSIRMKSPETLLDRLAEGYSSEIRKNPPRKLPFAMEDKKQIVSILNNRQAPCAACGLYAAQRMGFGVTEQMAFYVSSLEEAGKACDESSSKISPDPDYGDVLLIESSNPSIWFNLQRDQEGFIIDDIQLYLEMTQTRPRGPKIAEAIRPRILGGI
ncbi:MAG: hypothetical protein JW828_03250 [Sedimentisphaerales bacterium]|nr:hypothetical protein [Sedimentisphaerales bacterium]